MDAGADVVGGCPHIDPDPLGCLEACFALAGEHRPADRPPHRRDPRSPRLDVRDFAAS